MRKFTALVLLNIFLLSSTEFNQLLKLPKLFEHFSAHQSQDASLSFLEFLYIHYGQGEVQDADHEEDMKLPFKTQSVCSTISIIHKAPVIQFIPAWQEFVLQKENLCYTNDFVSGLSANNIWRPPQTNSFRVF